MMLGTLGALGAILLVKMLTGKGGIRVWDGIIRAGKDF